MQYFGINGTNHCHYAAKLLAIDSQCHLKKYKGMSDKEVCLNTYYNYELRKKIHCVVIGKEIDSDQTCIKISKSIIQDMDMLNSCNRMFREISINHDQTINENNHIHMT